MYSLSPRPPSTVTSLRPPTEIGRWHATEHFFALHTAISFARKAHHGQKRLDGRAYLSHPFAVLQILLQASHRLPRDAYITALLHDTIEDDGATYDEIADAFGDRVATAVIALTRPNIPPRREVHAHEEAYLQRMQAMNREIPFIFLVKMADRLHNLETSHFLPRERQSALIADTATLYLPLFMREAPHCNPFAEAHRRLLRQLQESVMQLRSHRAAYPLFDQDGKLS